MSTKKKHEILTNIENVSAFIEDRISEIKTKISNIDKQLFNIEIILNELRQKINNYTQDESKHITRSKLIRWYLDDLKIYNELNNIRIKYEELLHKYTDQLSANYFKSEELKIKLSKLESENTNLQETLEKIEELIKTRNNTEEQEPDIIVEENLDEKFSL